MSVSERLDKRDRTVKMARTYLKKAVGWLHWDKELPVMASLYWDLLNETLDAAEDILELLPDDYFATQPGGSFFGLVTGPYNMSDEPQERVEKLVALLERRRSAGRRMRKIALLEAVEGRTPVEQEAFRAKAAELREKEMASGR